MTTATADIGAELKLAYDRISRECHRVGLGYLPLEVAISRLGVDPADWHAAHKRCVNIRSCSPETARRRIMDLQNLVYDAVEALAAPPGVTV